MTDRLPFEDALRAMRLGPVESEMLAGIAGNLRRGSDRLGLGRIEYLSEAPVPVVETWVIRRPDGGGLVAEPE